MKYYCADCGELVAEMSGKMKRGTVMICKDCDRWNDNPLPSARKERDKPTGLPGALLDSLFGKRD